MAVTQAEHHWFARHHGVITHAEARALGLHPSAIARRIRSGQWLALHRGVYRHAAVPMTWLTHARAATTSTVGLLSHRAAARLWGLEGFERAKIEVVVPEGRQRPASDFLLHQSRQFTLADARQKDRIDVTGINRTILDLAAVLSPRKLEHAVDAALRQRKTRWDRLLGTWARHSARGRNGCGPLRSLLDKRFGERVPDSAWNRMVGHLLTDAGLPEPCHEFTIDGPRGFVARVDLAYPAHRLAIECDSRRHHDHAEAFERDPVRRNRLTNLGWRVYNVTWNAFANRPHEVVQTIAAALDPTASPLLTDASVGNRHPDR